MQCKLRHYDGCRDIKRSKAVCFVVHYSRSYDIAMQDETLRRLLVDIKRSGAVCFIVHYSGSVCFVGRLERKRRIDEETAATWFHVGLTWNVSSSMSYDV